LRSDLTRDPAIWSWVVGPDGSTDFNGPGLAVIDPRLNSVAAVLGGVEDDITDRVAGRLTGHRPMRRL